MKKITESEKRKRDAENRSIIRKVSRICGVTERQVERVINGEQSNEMVTQVFIRIQEAEVGLEADLLKEVQNLIPFN